ncbi:FxsA family protein [Hydrogenimonas thermophila]|uniref:FxsA family protein n=1 Tax=Hydrogenimonas thermophila TaxID=223786 RepID=UPI0029372E21|nr:FxsA family protein [Hydrogenimonas thermophila]WOE71165.1 FxsA family protein [Hydrogenimonas thermophila]WOE73683.1 FxsA family protein [Hydrogenimonas thermophila]
MIYFFIYLFLETFVSVEIGSAIGPFWTFIEIVVSAFAGLLLLTNFRYTFFENVRAMVEGEITPETFQKQNLSTLIGAILLIVPGFFTDFIGILLYFGVFTNLIVNRLSKREKNSNIKTDQFQEGECDVIDVEIIERHDDRK